MNLKLSSRHFKILITVLVLLNLFFLGGTWLYNSAGDRAGNVTKFLLLQLDLAHENVLSAWYSSMLLFLVAIMCALCFMIDKKRFQTKADAYINAGWIILSLAFATLSLDELGSFHETIGDTALFEIFGKSEGWQVFNIVIIVAGAFMILFSWVRLRRMPFATALMILGALLLLSNPMQENFEIETMRSSANPSQWKRPVIFILLEEGSEVFATICFLAATFIYYTYANRKLRNQYLSSSTGTDFQITKIKLLRLTISLIILLGLLLAVISAYMHREANNETGIPKNWFPSIITFIVFIISFYFFNNKTKAPRSLFLFMSILSILLSAYCGVDLYEHHFNDWLMAEKIFDWIIIASVLISGIKFLREQHANANKLLICLWAAFTCLPFILNKFYTSECISTGFSFLLIAFVANYYSKNDTENDTGIL